MNIKWIIEKEHDPDQVTYDSNHGAEPYVPKADYDKLLAEADALRNAIRHAPFNGNDMELYDVWVDKRTHWDNFRKGIK